MTVVYFMRLESPTGEIKIGVSFDVKARRAQLQASNPYPMTILATRPGGVREEYAVQSLFLHLRLRGEWFRPGTDLLAYIADLPEVLPTVEGSLPKSVAHQESLRELHRQQRERSERAAQESDGRLTRYTIKTERSHRVRLDEAEVEGLVTPQKTGAQA